MLIQRLRVHRSKYVEFWRGRLPLGGGGEGRRERGEDDTDIAVLTRGVEGARLNAHGDDSTREVEARSSTGDGGARDDEGTALFDTAEPVPSGTTDATVKLEEEEEQSSDDNRSPGPASEEMAVELTEEGDQGTSLRCQRM